MSEFVKWSETKAKIREVDPDWDSHQRVTAGEPSREQLRAELRGTQVAEMGKPLAWMPRENGDERNLAGDRTTIVREPAERHAGSAATGADAAF